MTVLAARRHDASPAIPRPIVALNLAVALCVLAYWVPVWYSYASRGVTWYASDQAVPFYAALLALASSLTLAGRFAGRGAHVMHWGVFAVDALVFTAAAVYLTFARFDRLL